MIKLTKLGKVLLFLTCLTCILWFGTYFARLFLSYQLFQENEFQLKPIYNLQNLKEIFIFFNSLVVANITFYVLFLVLFIIFIFSSKINVKQNGWFFILMAIIFSTAPFEIYLMTIDLKIINAILGNNFNVEELLNLIIKRLKVFGSFSFIELLAYSTIILLIIFKPLTRNSV